MLDKVIILELKEEYAIAMKEGGGMIRIQRKPGMSVGDRIYVLAEDLWEEKRKVVPFRAAIKNQTAVRRIARMATAAAMAVLILVALMPGLATKAYAVVSIDAGQRVQLEVDQEQSVLKASSIDGSLPDTQLKKFKGKKLFDLGPELIEMLGKGPFLVAYATYDGASDPQIEQEIRQMFQQKEIVYLSGNSQDISSAEENAQSLGLYMLGLLMGEENSDFLEDFYEQYFGMDDFEDDEEEDSENESDGAEYEHLHLHEMIALVRQNPEYLKSRQFRHALSEKIEDLDEGLDRESDDEEEAEADEIDDGEDSSEEEDDKSSYEVSDNGSDEEKSEHDGSKDYGAEDNDSEVGKSEDSDSDNDDSEDSDSDDDDSEDDEES